MWGDNESLHHSVSHKPGRPDFWKNKSDHKKYETQGKVAERTKFMSMKQEIDELIIKYRHCLRNASRYCEFEKHGQEEQTIEEDLMQLRLIEDIYNASYWCKIMEQLQIGNMSLNTCIEFIQQQDLIQEHNHYKSQPSGQIFADIYMLKKIKRCSYCGREHEIKRKKCPAFAKICANCIKKIFSNSIQIQKEKRLEFRKNKNKNVEKIEQKKKD